MRRAELQSFKRKIVVIILTAEITEKSAEFRGVFKALSSHLQFHFNRQQGSVELCETSASSAVKN
jgi:hypothetical protein